MSAGAPGGRGFGDGLYVGADARLDLRGVSLRVAGDGVTVQAGASLTLDGVRVEGTHWSGIGAASAGTVITLRDVAVRGVAHVGPYPAVGVLDTDGARVEARAVLVERAGSHGVWASGGSSTAVTDDLAVLRVNGREGVAGFGLVASAGARIEGTRVSVVGVQGAATAAAPGTDASFDPQGRVRAVTYREGSTVRVHDLFVRDVGDAALAAGQTSVAYGLHAGDRCQFEATRAVVWGAGLGLFNAGRISLKGAVLSACRVGFGAATTTPPALLRVRSVDNRVDGVTSGVGLPSAVLRAPVPTCPDPPCA